MPYRNIRGQLLFVFCFFCLSTTTTAQMDIDRLPPATVKVNEKATKNRSTRILGLQLKNPRAAGRQRAQNRQSTAVSQQRMTSLAYKQKRFRRTGKMTGNTAPRRKQLMGPAYKNERFKVRRARVAKFKKRG